MAQNNVSEIKKLKKDVKLLNSRLNDVLKDNEELHDIIEKQNKKINELLEIINNLIEIAKKHQDSILECQIAIIKESGLYN